MSRGLGRMEREIIACIDANAGKSVAVERHLRHVFLARGVYDMRAIARQICDDGRGFSDERKQASFSRAHKRLIEKGIIEPLFRVVPVNAYNPDDRRWFRIEELADGPYWIIGFGTQWRRRFFRKCHNT